MVTAAVTKPLMWSPYRPQNDLYMFMEYCSEGTLWNIAQQGLSEQMIRHYTRDIVRAVYFLHDKGIVHRDIKGTLVGSTKHCRGIS